VEEPRHVEGDDDGRGSLPLLGSVAPGALPLDRLTSRPLLWLATALDATLVGAMRVVVERFLMADAAQSAALRRSAEPFLHGSPDGFLDFTARPELPEAERSSVRRRLRGGRAVARSLVTEHAPDDPILIEHWVHDDRPAPATVLAVHGFAMGWPRLDATALFAADWYALGLDVALLTLPGHGPRTPSSARFSGDAFARPDVAAMNATAAQALYEIGLATRWLRRASGRPVGLLGLSLGGYLCATAASLDPDLAFVIAMVPPVCFGDLAWRFYGTAPPTRAAGSSALSYDELRAAYRVHSPLGVHPRVPRERLLIVAGRGDRIVPPEHPHALWRHWQEPAIHWFHGSHLAPFGRRGIVAAVRSHFARVGVLA
jgi:hypothetical protein